jgi:hypothetical protein
MGNIWSWLGLGAREPQEYSPLRDLVDALDRLEPHSAHVTSRDSRTSWAVSHMRISTRALKRRR